MLVDQVTHAYSRPTFFSTMHFLIEINFQVVSVKVITT